MQNVNKRTRTPETCDMPGGFPGRQKITKSEICSNSTDNVSYNGPGAWIVSCLLSPLRAAKGWLSGAPQENRQVHAYSKQNGQHISASSCSQYRKQNHRRLQSRRRPLASIGKKSYRKSLLGYSSQLSVAGAGAGATGARRKRINSALVREYTSPSVSNWLRSNTTPTTNSSAFYEGTPVPSQISADDGLDDTNSILTVDSSLTECRGRYLSDDNVGMQFGFGSDTAKINMPYVRFSKNRSSIITNKIGTADEWIVRLRKKIEETLSVTAPSAHILTPAYDRVCKEESDFDTRLEKARQKMAFTLPSDAQLVIRKANASSFTTEINNVPVSAHDISTLGDGKWLNDEVINFYMQLIISRSEKNPALPKVHAFNTFFFSTLRESGYARVRRWTRRIKLFEKDLVIVPVHLGVHWCCAVVDFRHKTIKYYDALLGDNQEALELLMDYLHEECKDKCKEGFDSSGWSMECDKQVPRQKNGYDCGVFAITFAEYVSRNASFAFSQAHCSFLRKKITYEIATQSLTSTIV
ncbi:hypothetical protein BX070DRAFT_219878 [Coemansia spiralis]|nr:hypothetical protein BX070DRAFT_219878 [Coemansia spiralis]